MTMEEWQVKMGVGLYLSVSVSVSVSLSLSLSLSLLPFTNYSQLEIPSKSDKHIYMDYLCCVMKKNNFDSLCLNNSESNKVGRVMVDS